ncbi:MAG: hypothetical protein LWX11_02140, partial [Firmicutes bacterium]|nr:hypothetical protein [Bacillota bacterium]
IFIPGDLPMRTKVGLDLLRLNPLSKGARSRTVTWEDGKDRKAEITQVRGSGGVLHLWVASEGTWLCDKEAPLRALVFPTAQVTLAERQEWGRVALAGVQAQTEVSLWIVPRIGANATFERLALRRRALGLAQQTWANPSIAKAAPRLGSLSVALGAGPTEAMLATLLEDDEPVGVSIPTMPEFASDGRTLTPSQRRDYQAAVQSAKERQAAVKGLHGELLAIRRLLDLRGAALHWNGWTPAPPLSAAQKAAMAELQKLKKEDRYRANRQEMAGKVAAYGGFGEPGMTPSVALALPIQSGKSAQVEALLKAAWPKLFKGSVQQREYAKGLVVHRTRTEQAFAPAYAVQGETLVVGSDDGAVQNVLAGLLGQTPTLADTPSTAYGRIALDGAKAAKDLETLLVAYLRTNFGARYWWMSEPDSSQDEVASEMAATFAPFLGVLKGLGVQNLSVELGPGGFEVRPR